MESVLVDWARIWPVPIAAPFKEDWPGFEYDLLRRNCCLFSKEFVEQLGTGPVPGWVAWTYNSRYL